MLWPAMRTALILVAVLRLTTPSAFPQSGESIEVQRARTSNIAAKGKKAFYTVKFNLDDLPHYKPEQKVSWLDRRMGGPRDPPLGTHHLKEPETFCACRFVWMESSSRAFIN